MAETDSILEQILRDKVSGNGLCMSQEAKGRYWLSYWILKL